MSDLNPTGNAEKAGKGLRAGGNDREQGREAQAEGDSQKRGVFVSRARKWNQGGTGTRRHLCTSHSQRLCGLCPARDVELTAWGARQVRGPITTQDNRSREPQPLQRGREAQTTPRDITWLSSHSGSGRTQPRKSLVCSEAPKWPSVRSTGATGCGRRAGGVVASHLGHVCP